MKIEVGKEYKRRDGKIAKVLRKDDQWFMVLCDFEYAVKEDGSHCNISCYLNLISEVVPEPIFDPNKPYSLRNGTPCKIAHTLKDGRYVVVTTEYDSVAIVASDGRYSTIREDNNDLVNIPEKIEGWLNVYPSNSNIINLSPLHSSKEFADRYAEYSRIACIFISITKGEGL